jgi:Domain of unknown function (DUF4398)
MPKLDHPRGLYLAMGLLALLAAACTSSGAPDAMTDISSAELAIEAAEGAEAAQYSPTYLQEARDTLEQARALQSSDPEQASQLAQEARSTAELAAEESRAQTSQRNELTTEEGEMVPEFEAEGLTGGTN